MTDTFIKQIEKFENDNLQPYAKKSFEPFSPLFVDGNSLVDHYSQQPPSHPSRARSPLQTQRDRILYSVGMRKQTEKYHVLFNGRRRIVRNYITHTMKMAQVARAICRGLGLNGDFAEAIALGAKIGAPPFVHASKLALAKWAEDKLTELNSTLQKDPLRTPLPEQLALHLGAPSSPQALPTWLAQITSQAVLHKVFEYIPWAAGRPNEPLFSTGTQSYWSLATNPLTLEVTKNKYSPETVFGLWRHTRLPDLDGGFVHKMRVLESGREGTATLSVSAAHATYEAIVVRYADDITWAIENLNDADHAAILNERTSIYTDFAHTLSAGSRDLRLAAFAADASALYSYFILDFVTTSARALAALQDGAMQRAALRAGDKDAVIGLSPEGQQALDGMITFLHSKVFSERRVQNRNTMLTTVALACADLLYDSSNDALAEMIMERGAVERWSGEQKERAQQLLRDEVCRIQAVLNVLSQMGDQEIFEFVGIDAI